ncbi:MAG TPA: hypothetical protein VII58_02290 [Acidobacteriaceae bacterium]
MAKVSIVFGVVLIVLGAWGFVATGSQHPTALIPAYFGLALGLCGALVMRNNGAQRALWMHVAVTLGLLGFLGSGAMAIKETASAHGGPLAHPPAVEAQTAMAVVCLIFVLLCVRSFIAARRAREAA